MRLLILAHARQSYTTRRLLEAAAGHRCVVASPTRFRMHFGSGTEVFGDQRSQPPHAVIARFGVSFQEYGCWVLRQLQATGVVAPNGAESVLLVRDRIRCLSRFAEANVPTLRGVCLRRPEHIDAAITGAGGLPVMLRRVSGTPTFGAVVCETRQGCLAAAEALWGLGQEVLVTESVHEPDGIRCLVIGGETVAAIRRRGKIARTRYTFERRGKASRIKPTRQLQALMRRVADATGLGIAGVDVIETTEGWRVVEVSAAPGLEQLEATTGLDLAGEMIAHTLDTVRAAKQSARREAARESS